MQFYFKAQSQHGHSMLLLAVELAWIRSFCGDAPYHTDRIRCGAGGEAAERETPKSAALSALIHTV